MRISDWSSDVCSSDLLVILNYIANHIIQSGNINREFLAKHASFKRGVTNIGYGLRPEHPLEQAATHAADANSGEVIGFDEFAAFVKPYTLDYAVKMSGVERGWLQQRAALYADTKSSEERRVGKGCVSTCRSRGAPYH